MKILFGKRNAFIDVFIGEGWEHWTRVQLKGDVLHHVKGRHLTAEEAQHVFGYAKSK